MAVPALRGAHAAGQEGGRAVMLLCYKRCQIRDRTEMNRRALEEKAGRICEHCGGPIAATKRAHARHCSRTCTTAAQGRRRSHKRARR